MLCATVQGKDKFALFPFQLVSVLFSYALKDMLGYFFLLFLLVKEKRFPKLYPLFLTLQELAWVLAICDACDYVTGPLCLDWCLRIKRFGKTHSLFHSFMILSVALAGFLSAHGSEMESKIYDSTPCSSQLNLSLDRNQQDSYTSLHPICFFPFIPYYWCWVLHISWKAWLQTFFYCTIVQLLNRPCQ